MSTSTGPAEVRASAAIIVAAVIEDGRSLDDAAGRRKRRRLGARAQALAVLRHAALALPAGRGPECAGDAVARPAAAAPAGAARDRPVPARLRRDGGACGRVARPSVRRACSGSSRQPGSSTRSCGASSASRQTSCTPSTATWRCAPRIRAGSSMRCARDRGEAAAGRARRQQCAPADVAAREPHARRRGLGQRASWRLRGSRSRRTRYAPRCAAGRRRPADVRSLPGFVDGRLSVQDAAAQLAVELLDPQAGERILDACAAPGGKTCHVLERTDGDADVTALDVSEPRLARVRENLERLGLAGRLRGGGRRRTSVAGGTAGPSTGSCSTCRARPPA